MKLLNKLNMKYRFLILFSVFGLLPAMIISGIVYVKNSKTLEKKAWDFLEKSALVKEREITNYFKNLMGILEITAENDSTVQAIESFSKSINELPDYLKKINFDTVKAKADLKKFYDTEFNDEYKKRNQANSRASEKFLDKYSDVEIYLQHTYIFNNKNLLGQKNKLSKSSGDSSYDKHHYQFHQTFNAIVDKLGYYDLFIIEPNNKRILYSTYKEIDFGTTLTSGPASGTGLAKAVDQVLTSKKPVMTDMVTYFPSYDVPTLFMAVPVFNDSGIFVGVVAGQVGTKVIEDILTSNGNWELAGLQRTGDAYLVGEDKYLRSNLRSLTQNFEAFRQAALKADLGEDEIEFMKQHKTSALLFPMDTEVTRFVIDEGKSGTFSNKDYRGIPVHSAYRPIVLNGLKWGLVVKMDDSEILEDLVLLERIMFSILSISLIVILAFAWFIGSSLAKTLTHLVHGLNTVTENSSKTSGEVREASQKVSSATTEQASAIQETVATLNEITAMVNKSVDNAKMSADKAEESHTVTLDGKKAVDEMSRAMKEISESNESIMTRVSDSNAKIAEVVKVINEIAEKTQVINDIVFQTKLLSFNASVEAARAGEHGKGFAVVAEEVGNLAQMSGNAAKEIGDMLKQSIERVEKVVEETGDTVKKVIETGKSKVQTGISIADRCSKTLDQVVTNVEEVKKMMDEISLASKEQAEGINNITTAMNQLDESTHANTEIARQTSDLSENLDRISKELADSVLSLSAQVFGTANVSQALNPVTEVKEESSKLIKIKDFMKKAKKVAKSTSKPSAKTSKTEKSVKSEVKAKPEPIAKKEDVQLKKAVGADVVPDSNDPRFEDL